MVKKVFRYQIWHLVSVIILIAFTQIFIANNYDIMNGALWGISTKAWKIKLPQEILNLISPIEKNIQDSIVELIILELYRKHKISAGKAAELLNRSHETIIAKNLSEKELDILNSCSMRSAPLRVESPFPLCTSRLSL